MSSRDDAENGTRRPLDDAATAYARAVDAGRVLACKWIRLACARHLRDLERVAAGDPEFPYLWRPEVVDDVVLFFLGLRHSKGEWAGEAIELEPWQIFIVGSLFAWQRPDGTRRFRVAYVEVPRKNGKSTLAAGIGLLLAFFDDEEGAEVYAAATKRDQAKIVWLEAKRMVLRTPRLREQITALVANLHDHTTSSKFEPLGADADNLDGLNIHAAIVDELHAHKTRAMWDVLDTATGARRQPLLLGITTAGSNRAGVCYEQRLYVTKILEGTAPDDATFGAIYTIDEDDDPHDPRAWAKANPNLDVSVKREDLARQAKRAKQMPSALGAFLTKRLDVWVNADTQWMDMAAWERCRGVFALEAVAGDDCWIGLDLASRIDVAAMLLLFRRGEEYWLKPRFYLPAQRVHDGGHAETAHYEGWAREGWLTLTEGNAVDFRVIIEDLRGYCRQLAVREIPHDPYQAHSLATELLEEQLPMIEYPNNVKTMSDPMKELEKLVVTGKLHHDGNPMMTWMISNVVCHRDAKDNIFPRKAQLNLKIDGPVAAIMAVGRAMVATEVAEPMVTVL